MSFRATLLRFFSSPRNYLETADNTMFRRIVEQSADVICYLQNGRFTFVSPSAAKTLGWDPQSLIGQDGLCIVHPDDKLIVQATIARVLSEKAGSASVRARAVCGDGSLKWCDTSSTSDIDASGVRQTVLIIRDVSNSVRIEEELETLAFQDSLTGLGNRRAFDQSLNREWLRTTDEGGEMALLLLDIDYFKQFNDFYGHQTGDDCLRAVAACLREQVRYRQHVACRYGGEELAVILGSTSIVAATKIAEDIRLSVEALRIPHQGSTCSDHLTVSIGVASALAREGASMKMPEGLLRTADNALYQAKIEGRNRVKQFFMLAPSNRP